METHFSSKQFYYQSISDVDPSIPTNEFLHASSGILPFIGYLGTIFSPIKNDIAGNISKLLTKYELNTEKYSTLQAIIQDELTDPNVKRVNKLGIATDALLWLKRGLEMIAVFLELIVANHTSESRSEIIQPLINDAYTETLYRHHNWVQQKLVKFATKAAPYREDLMGLLADGDTSEQAQDKAISDLKDYLPTMHQNISVINKLYYENGFEK